MDIIAGFVGGVLVVAAAWLSRVLAASRSASQKPSAIGKVIQKERERKVAELDEKQESLQDALAGDEPAQDVADELNRLLKK